MKSALFSNKESRKSSENDKRTKKYPLDNAHYELASQSAKFCDMLKQKGYMELEITYIKKILGEVICRLFYE